MRKLYLIPIGVLLGFLILRAMLSPQHEDLSASTTTPSAKLSVKNISDTKRGTEAGTSTSSPYRKYSDRAYSGVNTVSHNEMRAALIVHNSIIEKMNKQIEAQECRIQFLEAQLKEKSTCRRYTQKTYYKRASGKAARF